LFAHVGFVFDTITQEVCPSCAANKKQTAKPPTALRLRFGPAQCKKPLHLQQINVLFNYNSNNHSQIALYK